MTKPKDNITPDEPEAEVEYVYDDQPVTDVEAEPYVESDAGLEPEPVSDLPPLPEPPLTESQTELRDKVSDANADLLPGQTVITTVAGDAVVVGTPVPSEADGRVASTLNENGDYLAVDTPVGRVVIGLESDTEGRVWISARCEGRDGLVSDSVLLRAGP